MDGSGSNQHSPSPALRLHDRAPGFRRASTAGDIALSDYRGRWLVFFSHPADFNLRLHERIHRLAKAQPDFARLDCDLLGLSVDSLYAHVAWLRDIERSFGVKVGFPLIEDSAMVIARAYGMLDAAAQNSGRCGPPTSSTPRRDPCHCQWYPMMSAVGCRTVAPRGRPSGIASRTGPDAGRMAAWRRADRARSHLDTGGG